MMNFLRNKQTFSRVIPSDFPPVADMHCHVLPGMDDGSPDVKTSIAMLQREAEEGISAVFATPHFYADEDAPDVFLPRRQEAALRLKAAMEEWQRDHDSLVLPSVYLGAEVAYFPGICHTKTLKEFAIGGGKFILVELPFGPVQEGVAEEIVNIRYHLGLCPMVAHLERHLPFMKKKDVALLLENGLLIQSNAHFLLCSQTERKALKGFEKGILHVLGSDAHNMDARPPEMGEAVMKLERYYGREAINALADAAEKVLDGAAPI